jgi:hypothetical protein
VDLDVVDRAPVEVDEQRAGGGERTLTAAEVRTEGALVVDLGRFTFTRVPDAGGLRVYDFAGTHA